MTHLPRVTRVLLHDTYFSAILSGEKPVDGRINKPPYDTLNIGDLIHFVGTQTVTMEAYFEITGRTFYKSFREMLEKEGIARCLPGVASVDDGVAIYHAFPKYEENEKQFGVVAFGIKQSSYKETENQ